MKLKILLAVALLAVAVAAEAATIVQGVGTIADVTPARDQFRALLGGGTVAGANGSFGGERREINWDGVPDGFSDPNFLPGNFFNVNSPRGIVLSTPGTGFMVSANAGTSVPPLFGFPNDLTTFSAQRLFTAVGSNITDVTFFLPGTTTAAFTSGFGAMFVDVETANTSSIELFDVNGISLGLWYVPPAGNQRLSFLGISFDTDLIFRARITSGSNTFFSNGVLGNPNDDFVVMDDFIYGEPVARAAVPEPGTLALLGLGLAGLGLTRRRKAH